MEKQNVALRRPNGIPEHELPLQAKDYTNGLLYFCHDLIRYGESVEDCIRRIVKSQTNLDIKNFKTVYLDSSVQEKDNSWAVTPYIITEVERLPEINGLVTEVVVFGKESIPNDFAWWDKEDLKEFLEEYDN